jgi:hypothetical protein
MPEVLPTAAISRSFSHDFVSCCFVAVMFVFLLLTDYDFSVMLPNSTKNAEVR